MILRYVDPALMAPLPARAGMPAHMPPSRHVPALRRVCRVARFTALLMLLLPFLLWRMCKTKRGEKNRQYSAAVSVDRIIPTPAER